MELILALVVTMFFSLIAFWHRGALPFIVLGVASIFTGLAWFDKYITDTGMAISLALILYGMFSFGLFFKYALWRKEE